MQADPSRFCLVTAVLLAATVPLAAARAQSNPGFPPLVLEAEQTVLTKPAMQALGLRSQAWSDSTLSLLRVGQHEMLYGTAGDSRAPGCNGLVGVPALGLADPQHPDLPPAFAPIRPAQYEQGCLLASPSMPNLPRFQTLACQTDPACIEATPFDNDYSSMTSVVHLRNGWIAAFVHGETHYWNAPGSPLGSGFYGRIGLYVSRDGGRTFSHFSSRPVIAGNVRFATVYGQGPDSAYDSSGGAAIVTEDGMVRVYYSDEYDTLPAGDPDQALAAACSVCIAVAAIPLDELTTAIVAGELPALKKYYRGGFTQPAVGGRFSPVISPALALDPAARLQEGWVVWPSVGYAAEQGLYVLAYMSQWGGIRIRTSADGLGHWSDGAFIAPHRADDQPAGPSPATPYPTIIGGGADSHAISGGSFWLTYQSARWNGGYDWGQSAVVRRLVSLQPARYRGFVGYFSWTEGFAGYSNGQGHWCLIADLMALRRLTTDAQVAFTAPHIEPTVEGWVLDGACQPASAPGR